MNRWARIVVTLAGLAWAGWLLAGTIGFRVIDDGTLADHTLISFVALLGLVLTQAWVAAFALAAERLALPRADRDRAEAAAMVRSGRRAAGWALVATLAALAQFTVSNALYPGRLGARGHAAAGTAAALVILVAMILEARALGRHGRAAAALDA
jgi:hypothetical protein